MDEIHDEDDEDMEEDLDLESVIKELESELEEGEDKDAMAKFLQNLIDDEVWIKKNK